VRVRTTPTSRRRHHYDGHVPHAAGQAHHREYPGTAGQPDRVAPWLIRELEAREDFKLAVLDLRDWDLPMFQETFATIGDMKNPTFSSPTVKKWNTTIGPTPSCSSRPSTTTAFQPS
jgi:hypothetical protein